MNQDLYVLLNRTCNLRCPYCFQRKADARITESPTPDAVTKSFNYLRGLSGLGHVSIMGGEACLEKKLLLELLEILKSRAIACSILTNGTIYIPELKNYREVLKHIQISIDSPIATHAKNRCYGDGISTLPDCIENARKYMADGFTVGAHGVLTLDDYRASVDGIVEILCLLPPQVSYGSEIEHGVPNSDALRYRIAKYYYKKRRQLPAPIRSRCLGIRSNADNGMTICSAGSKMMTLDVTTGLIYSCHETAGIEGDEFIMGSVSEQPNVRPDAVLEHMLKHDAGRYYVPGIPHFFSELLKYMLPMSVCWYNVERQGTDPYRLPWADLYVAWQNRLIRKNTRRMLMASRKAPSKRSGVRLAKSAKRILDKWQPCKDCAEHECCEGCQHLGADGCLSFSVACKVFVCGRALLKLPKAAQTQVSRLMDRARKLGWAERHEDEELA